MLVARADDPPSTTRIGPIVAGRKLDQAQQRVVAALAGSGSLLVIEGAAGAGKTTTLAAAGALLEMNGRRLVVVTPTLKAARVAQEQVGADAFSAAWLAHQHGYRWDDDGRWTREHAEPAVAARLLPGDLLLVDEAGMLDQDTARALLDHRRRDRRPGRVRRGPAPAPRGRTRRRPGPRRPLGRTRRVPDAGRRTPVHRP